MASPLIDLRAILRAQGRKRPLTLRPIQTTQAQAKALQRIYAPIMQVWSVGVRERILPAYARSLATFTGDSPADIEIEIEAVDEEAVRATLDFRALFREWAQSLMIWHVNRIGSQLTYATNVDLTTQLGGANETIEDLLVRNTALVRDVSDQARGRIADIVFRGLQQRTPIRDVAKEINDALGLGRARSLRIASDQTVKLSSALDALRGRQLGMDGYRWRHSGKRHFRPEHKARDGKYFAFGSDVDRDDPPGFAPFCGCHRVLTMEVDDEFPIE
jgi:SPP1 gp7 family putative phage head morphogenesis protein